MTGPLRRVEILRPNRIGFGPGLAPPVGPWAAERGLHRVLVIAAEVVRAGELLRSVNDQPA